VRGATHHAEGLDVAHLGGLEVAKHQHARALHALHRHELDQAAHLHHPTTRERERNTPLSASWQVEHSDAKVANRNFRDFGWEIAHGAVTQRPPISLYTMVPRTEGYAHDARVWDLSIFCRAKPSDNLLIRNFASLYGVVVTTGLVDGTHHRARLRVAHVDLLHVQRVGVGVLRALHDGCVRACPGK
jgi:hypothetical protein